MTATAQRYYGTVCEFNRIRGGYIEMDHDSEQLTGDRVFVRYSAILGDGLRDLEAGQRVSFEVEQDHHGLSALRVICE